MRTIHLLVIFLLLAGSACQGPAYDLAEESGIQDCELRAVQAGPTVGTGALIATRFGSLEAFKSVVEVSYLPALPDTGALVRLTHCSQGQAVTSLLPAGVSQKDINKVKTAGFSDKLAFVFQAPYAIRNRADLQRVYLLARRVPLDYGEGDPAFYDLALAMVANINTPDLAFQHAIDTTEKGYINTFNHITAQAFISSIFSEELADFIADVHERKNMPELITGHFSATQLTDPNNNPVDNYVDIINNEWGQELGKRLREKYHISRETFWTPALLASYLNDIQQYYSWALEIGFQPYRENDELVVMFANKINVVLKRKFKV